MIGGDLSQLPHHILRRITEFIDNYWRTKLTRKLLIRLDGEFFTRCYWGICLESVLKAEGYSLSQIAEYWYE